MRRRIVCAILALLLWVPVFSACGKGGSASTSDIGTGPGAAGDASLADATVMVYVVGSDLESGHGAASADILEMVNSGFDYSRNNLLVMTGGAKSWNRSTGISAKQLEIYQLGRRGLSLVSGSPSASMGEAGTLTDFLNYCYSGYPAKSYGLILWDHGGGPLCGYGFDELYNDSLSLQEMAKALEASPFGKGNKLSFLGFDASLMASAELAWSLRDYAQYLIASEEVIPAGGWDYGFLSRLGRGPLDGWQVGSSIVDSFSASCESQFAGESFLDRLTLSCVDLERAEELETAVDRLFAAMSQDLAEGRYSQIARARSKTLSFAKYTTDSEYDLIDLGDLADQLMEDHPEEAAALRQVVDSMVVYDWSHQDRAHGLSLYYPLDNKEDYLNAWGQACSGLGFAPQYASFLQRFGRYLSAEGSFNWLSAGLPPIQREEETGEYFIQLSEEQAAEYLDGCSYLLRKIAEGRYVLCGLRRDLTLDEENRLHPLFSAYSVSVFNNVGDSFSPLYVDHSETGSHDFHIAAALHNNQMGEGTFRLQNVWFLVSLPRPGDSDALGTAIERRVDLGQMNYGKNDLRLLDYPAVYFPQFETWESWDEEGRLLPVSQWTTQVSGSLSSWDVSRGWRAELSPLEDDGYEYFLQIVARDCCGVEYGSELIPVELVRQDHQSREEMFLNRFYPLPARTDPIPTLPPLDTLRYFTDSRAYSPAELKEQLILNDPSGIRMTLLAGVYRLDATGNQKDLVLIIRVDNHSSYFDMLDLQTDTDLRIPVGGKLVRVYFLAENLGVWMQNGGSYYYTLSIPCSQLPVGVDSLPCQFRFWQKQSGGQQDICYETQTVQIPLPANTDPEWGEASQINSEG